MKIGQDYLKGALISADPCSAQMQIHCLGRYQIAHTAQCNYSDDIAKVISYIQSHVHCNLLNARCMDFLLFLQLS